MPVPVDPIREPARLDEDAKWKRDVERFAREVVAWMADANSQIDALKDRVN